MSRALGSGQTGVQTATMVAWLGLSLACVVLGCSPESVTPGSGTGGVPGTGGTTAPGGSPATGGRASTTGGNASQGGTPGTGGAAGTSTGGKATGGTSTGGRTTGGTATGGKATGGTGAGGGCGVTAPAGSPVATHGQLQVVGNRIQDQSGNPVQLKGISSYWLNWESSSRAYSQSRSALQYARDNWKLSIIRAAMGVDASGGYLTSTSARTSMQAKVDTIVQNALALGVYVLIDWHTERAVDQQAESIEFFTGMANKYGACPNVLYEDYNEPTSVTWAQIKPYHQAVVNAIRAVDPDNVIILGTPNWSQDVDVAAASPVTGTNLAYTLHFYSCSHGSGLRTKGTTALSRGVALFVTEFGATPANGGVSPNNTVCEAEANSWFAWMEQNGVGGTAWKLSQGTDSSHLLTSSAPVDGPWTDSVLTTTNGSPRGHGLFIVNWIRQ